MCSIAYGALDGEEVNVTDKKSIRLGEELCKKCKDSKAVLVLRGRDAYCQSCFLTASTHKFWATLGKNKASCHL